MDSQKVIIPIMKWTAMSFSCLIIFSIGVFLGKQFSGFNQSPSKRTLKNVSQGDHIKKNTTKGQAVKIEPQKQENPQAVRELAEKESEGLFESPVVTPLSMPLQDSHSKDLEISPISDDHEENKKQPEDDTDKSTANPSLNKAKKTAHKLTKKQPENNPKSPKISKANLPKHVTKSLSGKYTIQVGVYKKEQQAMDSMEALKNQGLDAFYVAFQGDHQAWYRVSSGVYADKVLAQEELSRLLKTNAVPKASVQAILESSF